MVNNKMSVSCPQRQRRREETKPALCFPCRSRLSSRFWCKDMKISAFAAPDSPNISCGRVCRIRFPQIFSADESAASDSPKYFLRTSLPHQIPPNISCGRVCRTRFPQIFLADESDASDSPKYFLRTSLPHQIPPNIFCGRV